MSTFTRWWKFNFVGALGMIVQLTVLFLLNRLLNGRYLLASAVALEAAILHNFVWHLHYTWRDRRDTSSRLIQLLRFQLSNGLVSILGNLLFMQILVEKLHCPVLGANAVAILCCALVNFGLSDNWTFGEKIGPGDLQEDRL